MPTNRPPVRIIHLGIGAFARAHQVWYTANASDSQDWGVAAFTGRSPRMADLLSAQDGLYTLAERGQTDNFEVIGSIVEAHSGTDVDRLYNYLSNPEVSLVTLTITEAAYFISADGALDIENRDLAADVAAIVAAWPDAEKLRALNPNTVLARLLIGLAIRKTDCGAPLAIVPCDNIAENGPKLKRVIAELAQMVDADLAQWIAQNASFVSTSIDRITPRTDKELVDMVATTQGYVDEVPVSTEPYSAWILSGDFPLGRPDWESSGAQFVDDLEPYEVRKLWLLNGAHSLLAYYGLLRGHDTVDQAMGDPKCVAAVEEWWNTASSYLPADGTPREYTKQLAERFRNPRLGHLLAQIGNDGTVKLGQRVVPVAKRELEQGKANEAAALIFAAWIKACGEDFGFTDANQEQIEHLKETDAPVRDWIRLVDRELADSEDFVALVCDNPIWAEPSPRKS